MTEQQLQAIRDRVELATPGPWENDGGTIRDDDGGCIGHVQPHGNINTVIRYGEHYCHADADFIAHARHDVPALLAYVEWLENIIADAQKDATELFCGERQRGREEMMEAVINQVGLDDYDRGGIALRLLPLPAEPETIQAMREENRKLREAVTNMVGHTLPPDGYDLSNDSTTFRVTREALRDLKTLLNGPTE